MSRREKAHERGKLCVRETEAKYVTERQRQATRQKGKAGKRGKLHETWE